MSQGLPCSLPRLTILQKLILAERIQFWLKDSNLFRIVNEYRTSKSLAPLEAPPCSCCTNCQFLYWVEDLLRDPRRQRPGGEVALNTGWTVPQTQLEEYRNMALINYQRDHPERARLGVPGQAEAGVHPRAEPRLLGLDLSVKRAVDEVDAGEDILSSRPTKIRRI